MYLEVFWSLKRIDPIPREFEGSFVNFREEIWEAWLNQLKSKYISRNRILEGPDMILGRGGVQNPNIKGMY